MAKGTADKQSSIRFIFITILLDAMGIGLIIPVLPDVLRRFNPDPGFVAGHYGTFIGIFALMQFLASPVLGSLSDRYGRRPILLISLFFAAVDYLFMAFAPTLPLLYLGRVISGLTGASMTVAGSYMADISHDGNRSANFGIIGAAWGLGFILGPTIGGLVSAWGPTTPFLVAACLNLLNFAFGALVLPESLDEAHRRPVALTQMNPIGTVLKVLRPSAYVGLVWVFFILFLAGQVHPVNWTLYTQVKFGWTARQVGLSLSFVGLVMAAGNVGLTRLLIPRLGEERSLTLGLLVYIAAFLLFGVASQGWMMYPVLLFFGVSCIAVPALQSIVAKHVPSNRQGELQGSLVSLGSLAGIIAPLLFTALFTGFTKPGAPVYFPGAAYVGASVICCAALGIHLLRRPGGAPADMNDEADLSQEPL
jgi:DHA1 family tetracycline resistance protein-like MFS transporter